ncbi:hypothetical protein [Aeromonas veronii]|uniref:hypothetical protein n=1 Tax=Aeromonas veronii TaxID=654 RepID=UPI002B47A93F|nr:hypothetical protein [Aeromonas veronii]
MIYKVTPTLETRQRWIRRDIDRARKGSFYTVPDGLDADGILKWLNEVVFGGNNDT